eukprot:NODE_58_length_25774_cov_0.240545.p3 type:complete len:565 gc:universal NODE_58_length_25774_cov_0.240545:7443-5749(-)
MLHLCMYSFVIIKINSLDGCGAFSRNVLKMSDMERLPSYYNKIEGTTLDSELSLSRVTHIEEEPKNIPGSSNPTTEDEINRHEVKRSTQVKGNLIMNDLTSKTVVDKSNWFFIPESFFYPSEESTGWYLDPNRSNFIYSQQDDKEVPSILDKECWLELWHYEYKQLYYFNVFTKAATWSKPSFATVLQCKLLQDKTPRLQASRIQGRPEKIEIKSSSVGPISNPVAIRQDLAQDQNPFLPHEHSNSDLSSLPSLPQSVKDDISQFHMDGFADKYFTVHKKGIIFKKRIPNQELLWYTKQHLRQPLMQLNKTLYKDALRNFKFISKIMDENDLSFIPNVCELGIQTGGIRDEIYVQLVKQCNGNPSSESLLRGWKLMGVLLTCFPPSKNFESYLLNYFRIHANVDVETSQVSQSLASISRAKATEEWAKKALEMDPNIVTLGKHCLKKGKRICIVGPRGKNPSKLEIDKAWDAAFTLSLFGETLDDLMLNQAESEPQLTVPRILIFLSESLLQLGGTTTEGIFRVPGDVDKVGALVFLTNIESKMRIRQIRIGRYSRPERALIAS